MDFSCCMSMGMQMESLLAKETDHLKMVNGFKTIVGEFKQKCYEEAIQIDDSVNDAALKAHRTIRLVGFIWIKKATSTVCILSMLIFEN